MTYQFLIGRWIIGLIWRVFKQYSSSAWGCSNISNIFKLYGFPFNKKRLATWDSNVNREGWNAKLGISKLCEVGVDIILRRSRSRMIYLTTTLTVIRNFSCKQTRHMFPYDA